MATEAMTMTRNPGNVSPYLLRRLRSYQEALRERTKRSHRQDPPEDRADDRPSGDPSEAKPRRGPGGKADRDV